MPRISKKSPMRRRSNRKRRQFAPSRPMRRYNSQIFTETFKCNNDVVPTSPGVGTDGVISVLAGTQLTTGKFMVKFTDIPQQKNYANLQQAFKILKTTFIIVPKFGNAEANAAEQNAALPANSWENARIVYAVNDTNGSGSAPASELEVLQMNGCKIRPVTTRPLYLTCRPKPILDKTDPSTTTSIPVTPARRDWISFGDAATFDASQTPYHTGIDWVVSCDNTATTGFLDIADVYVKVSFVLKDPR